MLRCIVLCKSIVRTKAQVNHISPQPDRVFQRIDNTGFLRSATCVRKNLHRQNLGVRRNTRKFYNAFLCSCISCNSPGHMCSMVAVSWKDMQINIRIVAGIRHFAVLIQGIIRVNNFTSICLGSGNQLIVFQESLQTFVSIPKLPAGICISRIPALKGIIIKSLVHTHYFTAVIGHLNIQAAVQNSYQHTLACIAFFPDLFNPNHIVAVSMYGLSFCYSSFFNRFRVVIYMAYISSFYTVEPSDLFKFPIRNLCRKSI